MFEGGPSYTSRPPAPVAGRRRVSTSRKEVFDLGVAFLVLTVPLVLIFSMNTLAFGGLGAGVLQPISLGIVAIAALTAGTGFVAHELAHKVVAQRRGYAAEFRMWPMGLLFTFVTGVFGILWGAPGATVVAGMPVEDRRSWGLTSLAGPMANVAFALVAYGVSIVLYLHGSFYFSWALVLAWVNAWFGTFNLLPLGVLDGRKVLRWSGAAWAIALVATALLAGVAFAAVYFFNTPLLLR